MLLEFVDCVEVGCLANRQRLAVDGCVTSSPPLHPLLEDSQVEKAFEKLLGEPYLSVSK